MKTRRTSTSAPEPITVLLEPLTLCSPATLPMKVLLLPDSFSTNFSGNQALGV